MTISDYLTPLDEDTIRNRMLSALPDTLDKSEGSFLWDAIMPVAIELAIADERARLLFEWSFATTTFGEFLDLRTEEHGVIRRAAVAAVGTVTFTGEVDTVIPAGTEVSTEGSDAVDAQSFTTDEEATIEAGGTVAVAITAVAPGAAGNVGVGAITIPVDSIDGVESVTNAAVTTGGVDEESDESLLARYLVRVRNPGTSGNVADYKNWALEVSGVGAVTVVPLEDGPGTVTVAIVDSDLAVPDPALVTEVQDYIAPDGPNGGGKAPIGANVTVEGATAVPVAVEADLTIDGAYVEADVQTAIEEAIAVYFQSLTFADDNDVRHARVVTAILDVPGVIDATGVTINGAGANIVIAQKEIATLGATTWT